MTVWNEVLMPGHVLCEGPSVVGTFFLEKSSTKTQAMLMLRRSAEPGVCYICYTLSVDLVN
jgi:hypothetical protein